MSVSSSRGAHAFAFPPTAAAPSVTSVTHFTRTLLSLPARLISPGGHLSPVDLADNDSFFLTLSQTTTIHYKRYTSRDTPPHRQPAELIVAAHGFGSNSSSYADALSLLTQARQSLVAIAFDSPGFGLTTRPPLRQLPRYRPRYSGHIIRELAFREAPPSARPVYMGFSLGGRAVAHAALHAAARGPRPRALVLVCPALVPRGARGGARQGAARRAASAAVVLCGLVCKYCAVALSILLQPLLQLLLRVTVGGGAGFWVRGLSLAFGDPARLSGRTVAAYRRPLKVRGWARGILHFCRAMLLDPEVVMDDLVQGLRMRCADLPVLVVHGRKDKIIPLCNSQAIVAALPQAELVVVEGVGHMPHEEVPEEFVAIVDRFLSSHQQHQSDYQLI